MNNTQSNTRTGAITVTTASGAFTGKEGYLCKLTNASGVLNAALPAAATDAACFVITNVLSLTEAEITPLQSGTEVRVVVGAGSSAIVPGSRIVGFGGTADGQALNWAAGAAFLVGIAEEAYEASGQYLLIRPILGYIA